VQAGRCHHCGAVERFPAAGGLSWGLVVVQLVDL
jgi:hypothetical protein